MSGDAPASVDRGQTVLDFVVGMSVFLIAVGFTFAFVPSLLEPFTAGEGAKMVVAERGAAHLTETSFSAGGGPATLSAACTRDFFNGTDPGDVDCNWDHNAEDLHAELGVVNHHGLNLSVTTRGEPIGIDGDGEVDEEGEVNEDGTLLTAGNTPRPGSSVSSGSRIVDINGQTYRLTLRVW